MKYARSLEFWFTFIILLTAAILSVTAFILWYNFTFFVGPYLIVHWLGIIASVFIVVSNPLHYFLRKRRSQSKIVLRVHVFGNTFAFLLVSLHFAQNVGRLAGTPQELAEGVVLYLVLFITVATGFIKRFHSGKSKKSTKIIHKYALMVLIFILLIHTLEGFSILPADPQPSPSPTTFPTVSPEPSPSSSSPSQTYSPSQTPSPSSRSPYPSPPTVLLPEEIREYEGEDLSAVADFRENSIRGPQDVPIENYRLTITGLVNATVQYTYDEVLSSFQNYQKVVTLYCVEGWSVKILWEGFLVRDLLEAAEFNNEAKVVIFYAYDGYSTSLPLDYIINNDIIIAYKMNNITLPTERGFPFQLVAESKWGYKWIKWITAIEVSDDQSYLGYWESRGYPNDADLP